jgi:cation transport ATPase
MSATCTVCELHAESTFRIEGMDCREEVAILERRFKYLIGLEDFSADLMGQRLHVKYDAAKITAPYQGPEICGLKESVAGRNEFYLRVTKALAESVAFILDESNKIEVTRVLQRNLRLSKPEVIEGSYRVLRKMTTLDMAPNVPAFKSVQRILARIYPKITQVDLDQVIDASFVRNLESSGFLPELRKRLK